MPELTLAESALILLVSASQMSDRNMVDLLKSELRTRSLAKHLTAAARASVMGLI